MKLKHLISLILFMSMSFLFAQEPEETVEEIIVEEVIDTDENSVEIPFAIIEKVPIYQGCSSNLDNRGLKDCMANAISRHVSKKFNTDLAKELNLSGRIRIYVFFKIDKEGNVIDIKARAPHPKLQEEAIRVISLIPKLEAPGYQKGKPVIVPYNLPIVFMVETPVLTKKEMRKLKKKNKR